MSTRNILVSITAIVCVLALATIASAAELTNDAYVTVDGINAADNISVIAGETVTLKVYFTPLANASDVKVKAELEGDKVDVDAVSSSFDVEQGIMPSRQVLTLDVPFELSDEVSDDLDLTVKIWNGDYETELSYTLRVLRPSYNAVVKSISVSQTVNAGESLPVDFVLRNLGYNDLEDIYVTASIPALGVEKSAYFGDLVAIEDDTCDDCDDDETDTASGRLYLDVPYGTKSGSYAVELSVSNDDTKTTETKQVTVENDFDNGVIAMTQKQTVKAGEDATYELLIVNPTDSVKVYKVVAESSKDVASSVSESVFAVSAGSSKTVTVTANADKEGAYTFNVNVFSGESLVGTVALSADVEAKSTVTNPIVVLTIVLAIVFIVLLVVLIVLIGKKPEKTEEFGESYY